MRPRFAWVLLVVFAVVAATAVIVASVQSGDNEADAGTKATGAPGDAEYVESDKCRLAGNIWARALRSLTTDAEVGEVIADLSVLDQPAYWVKVNCSTEVRDALTMATISLIGYDMYTRRCETDPQQCDPAKVSARLKSAWEATDALSELIDRVE